MSSYKLLNRGVAIVLLATGVAGAQAVKPSDPQIAHVAYTAGDLDIKAAQLALKKSTNKDVVTFANEMARDHKAVNDQALALVGKLKVTPEDNDISKSLVTAADAKRAELNKLDGAAFDKAYVASEVGFHKTVNQALDKTLIPSSNNGELKSLLQTGLKLFQSHQMHAEHLEQALK